MKLTAEQLRSKFAEIDKSIDDGKYENAHPVFKKRVALMVLGEYLPQYDALPEEEKQNFGFDVKGLTKKVTELMDSSPSQSENYGELKVFHIDKITGDDSKMIWVKESDRDGYQMYGGKHEVNYNGQVTPYWVPKSWISGKGITVEQAYRIFEEDSETLKVREVRDYSEIDAIVQKLWQEIRQTLGR
jgi:hypothetical protein